MRLTKKYPGIVERFYTMNPRTERIETDPTKIENGMVVLLAAAINRWPVEDRTEDDYIDFSEVLKKNRWCTVKNITFFGDTVTFTGVYQDGKEVQRTFQKDTSWLVKLDPVFDNPAVIASQFRSKVEGCVLNALIDHQNGNDAIVKLAETAASHIMELIQEEQT